MSEIVHRVHALEVRTTQERIAVLRAWNEEHYYPALRAIQADCAAEGHLPGEWQSNGLGVSYRNCTKCGARAETDSGPQGES